MITVVVPLSPNTMQNYSFSFNLQTKTLFFSFLQRLFAIRHERNTYICKKYTTMKKQYTDIFIDFDDTIYDTHGNAEIALSELFDKMGFDRYFSSLEDFTRPYWTANIDLWRQYAKGEITRDYLIVERFRRPLSVGMPASPSREYCLEVSDMFLDLCSNKPGILDGARELLDYLHSRYRLHLCSNGFHEVQYKKLKASDTYRYFTTICLSEDAGANKPSTQFFDYALSQSGAAKENTIMIGDNFNTDILGARASGIDQLYYNRWGEPYEESNETCVMVNTLREIISKQLL